MTNHAMACVIDTMRESEGDMDQHNREEEIKDRVPKLVLLLFTADSAIASACSDGKGNGKEIERKRENSNK
jgi:hypothetical protein